jgi:hypothetical protein
MNVRRAVTVLAAASLMVLGGQQLAGAAFSDTPAVATTVVTTTVAPVTKLSVTAPCTLTTTTYTTTTRRAADGTIISGPTRSAPEVSERSVPSPVRGYSSESRTTTNWDGTTTTVVTETYRDTTVSGVATWQRSTTKDANSYTLTIPGPAPFSANLGDTTRYTYPPISIDQNYTLPITVTTNTPYGWTAAATAWVSTCTK